MALQPTDRIVSSGATYSDDGQASVRDKGRELVDDAMATGRHMVGRAGERARTGIEDSKTRAARELGTVAHALRGCGGDLGTEENSMLAPYVERVADQVDRVANMLETRTVDDIARDVETFARRNPAVFLGACFGVGVLAARFLKSSKPHLPVVYNPSPNVYGAGSPAMQDRPSEAFDAQDGYGDRFNGR